MTNIIVKNMTQLSKETVESLHPYVKLTDTDTDSGLENFCYHAVPDVESEMYKENKDVINRCRGVVYDGKKVVMQAFSYTPEFSSETSDAARKFCDLGGTGTTETDDISISRGMDKCSFFESHEGILIRMFFHGDKWFVTTHRKLNAFKSRWGGGDSHGTMFKDALKDQLEMSDFDNAIDALRVKLDTSRQYMFLVCNTKTTRLVCTAPENPSVYHVGTFVDGVLDTDDDIGLAKPVKLNFKNIDEVYSHVNAVDPLVSPGVIVFAEGNEQFKISSSHYINLFNLRGNQSSLKFRYLEVRSNNQSNGAFRQLYPESVADFDTYEQHLNTITTNIHGAYISRFVKKEFVSVPPAEYNVIKIAHSWFKADRQNRVVTGRVIYDILNEQTPPSLNQMIKHILYPEKVRVFVPPVKIITDIVEPVAGVEVVSEMEVETAS